MIFQSMWLYFINWNRNKKIEWSNDINLIWLVFQFNKTVFALLNRKYKAIQSKQQLRQYTLEFEQNHKEYSDLYEFLAPTAKQFDTYQKELEEIGDKNSKEATEKKDTILRVYFDKKSDSEFSKKRERYDYLDLKLNFIKGLISQYKVKNETQNTNISPFSPWSES